MRRSWAGVLAAAALGLAACGGGTAKDAASSADPGATTASTVETTGEPSPAAVAFAKSLDPGFAQEVAAQPDTVTYVGAIDGTELYIGVVRRGDEVEVYVCDGTQADATTATWLTGRIDGDKIAAASDAAAVDATLQGDGLEGTVTIGSVASRFVAQAGSYPADVWQSYTTSATGISRTGWIVLEDGSVRGATKTGPTISVADPPDPLAGDAVTGGGTPPLPADPVPTSSNRNKKAKPPSKAQQCQSVLDAFNFWLDKMGDLNATDEQLRQYQYQAETTLEFGSQLGCSWVGSILSSD